MSAQYCRYCSHMICGDFNYCRVREKLYSDEHIKRTNKCKDFDLNSIDALQENAQGYVPRKKKKKLKPLEYYDSFDFEPERGW